MHHLRRYVCLFFVLLGFSLTAEQLKISVHAETAILMNAKTGAVLFEKESEKPAYPASTTKIALALYLIEKYGETTERIVTVKKEALASITPQAKRDSNYRSPPHWLETDGSHIGLKVGEELSMKHLLHAALIASGNDACNALALQYGGTVPTFMQHVNVYLKDIGCTHTEFNNPHGLHHPQHMTTAHDLAVMACRGLQLPLFRQVVGTTRYICPRSNLEEERTFVQTNLFLRQGAHFDARVIGIKTGSTQAAGKNLVSAAKEGERELVAVVMGCQSRAEVYQDSKALFDAAFGQSLMRRTFMDAGPTSLTCPVRGARGELKTMLPESLCCDFYPAEEREMSTFISWQVPLLPIKAGTQVGSLHLIDEQGTTVQCVPLCAAIDLKRSWWRSLWIMPPLAILIFSSTLWLYRNMR